MKEGDKTAYAFEVDGEFVVLTGSPARKEPGQNWTNDRGLRDRLIEDGKLIDTGNPDHFEFAEDVAFSSPSAAAAVGTDPRRARWEFVTLATMYVCYAAFMLCRNTVVAAGPAMIQDPSLGLDVEKFGRLMSWASVGAIVGKLVTGIGADRIGGRRLFLLTLFLTAACTAALGMVSSVFFFGGLNFAGQFFKAGGWPAMAKIIGKWYPRRKYGRVWSIISTSSRVGTIVGGVGLGALLTWISWRAVFLVSASVAAVIVIVGYVWLKDRPEDVGISPLVDEDTPTAKEPHLLDSDGTTLFQASLVFALRARVWLICLGVAPPDRPHGLLQFYSHLPE